MCNNSADISALRMCARVCRMVVVILTQRSHTTDPESLRQSALSTNLKKRENTTELHVILEAIRPMRDAVVSSHMKSEAELTKACFITSPSIGQQESKEDELHAFD